MYEGERVVILVVQEEEAFGELLQHFPMDDYTLMFAAEPAEALALCEIKTPKLIVVPTAFAGGGLADVLAEVRPAEALILGLAPTKDDVAAAVGQKGIFDRVVFGGDAKALVETAKELLKERRLSPRVNLEFPIHIGEKGEAIVREFSATSLRVETAEQLRAGAIVKVSIGWGPRPLKFEAVVGKVEETMFFGQVAAVLHLHDQEAQAKEYLDVLVRRVVELQYLLAGDEDDKQGKLRGTSAWDLARRAEKILRDSKGLKIRDSGELIVDEKAAAAEASAAAPGAEAGPDEDVLETRYKVGEKVDSWGVGDVYKATHRLLERPVLLKRLRPDLASDVNARLRLELEARVAAGFAGKNIVDVLDFGSDGRGGLYYAMESMNGETLAAALERGQAFTPLEIASLGIHLTYALARIHLRGGGHFDLCPQNVYLKRTMGTTVVPVLINVAGPEVWTQPSPTYTRGSDYRPPDAPLSYPGPDCDVYALTMILQEVLSVSTHLAGGLSSPGAEDLLQVLRMAGARDRNERIADAQSLREALAKSLSMLEAESDDDGHGSVTQPPPAIGRPRPSQLGSIPAPDLSDSYLEKVMALEGAVPIAGLRRTARASQHPSAMPPVQGAQSVAGTTRRPSLRPAPTPPPIPIGEALGGAIGGEPSSIQLVEDDLELVDFAPDPVLPPRAGGSTLPAPPPPTFVAPAQPAPAPASSRRGRALGAVVGAGVVVALALVALALWQPWRRGAGNEVTALFGSSIAPPAVDAAPPRDASKRLEIGDAQVSSPPATVLPPPTPPAPVDAVPSADAGVAADASKVAPTEAGPEETPDDEEGEGDASVEESPAEARRTLMGKARRRVRRGLYNEALEFLASAAEIRNGADIQSLLAEVYEKRGQYRPALVSAKRAVDLSPTNARYHDQLGSLYVKQGQRPQACASFRQATTLNPTLSSAKRHLGQYCR